MTEVEGIYTIAEAAEYLDMSERAVYHHVFVSKKLPGTMRLGRRTFTKAELDTFKANPPKRGNPTSKPRNTKKRKAGEDMVE